MIRKASFLGLALLFGLCGIATADIAQQARGCDGCHGQNGVSQVPGVPTIWGLSAIDVSESLYMYRDEERPCGAINMCIPTKQLSDDQIEALAEHYAALEFVAIGQQFDIALAEQGKLLHDRYCENCHPDNGSDPQDEASILAGQRMDYLRQQFAYFQAGTRPQPPKKEEKLKKLSEQDIEALLNFYASFQ
jgi:sulfide dehydrogenase cytochrome subunit